MNQLINAIGTITFPEYRDIEDLLSPPDNFVSKDPLSGRVAKVNTQQKSQSHTRVHYFDTLLWCVFRRFNKDYNHSQFQLRFKEFKETFKNELRNATQRLWRQSTNKRDKGEVLRAIENEKTNKFLIQWMADVWDILVKVDDREYIPRKDKENKPKLLMTFNDGGYRLI